MDPQFAGDVMGKDVGGYVRLVADPGPDRYVIHPAMRPGLGEDTLLRPTALTHLYHLF